MAYSNATFYLDFVNGSDTARTGFAPTAYANNGSGLVRVTKTAHGLVTDAVVTITGTTSSVYNGDWKITKVDNDNFDLQASTYSVNPAAKGTVTPFGGMSWTDAWKTIDAGATAARIAPGDTIRVAKTADPTSIGNATWTSKSATVTLASAQTTNVYMDGAWTLANSATVTTTTTRKEGTNAASITTPASTATATKYAYYATGTLDLSSYDAITLWFNPVTTATADSNRYVIKLCSDTAGDTAVDEFAIPANAIQNRWMPLTLTRNGGGNLGNSIKSIALYTGSSSPGNSQTVYIDNVLGCSSTGLNLTALMSKSSAGYTNSETWHCLQSINGTTVYLADQSTSNAGSSSLRGYYTTGTSPETVTTYIRPTYKFATQSTTTSSAQPIQDSGTAGNLITFSGGWDTSSTTQNGMTWIDGQNGYGAGIAFRDYTKVERFGLARFYSPIVTSIYTGMEVDSCMINSYTSGAAWTSKSKVTDLILNNGAVFDIGNCLITNLKMYNTTQGLNLDSVKATSLDIANSTLPCTIKRSQIDTFQATNNIGGWSLDAQNTTTTINEATISNNLYATSPFGGSTTGTFIINKLTSSGNTGTTGNTGSLIVKQTASSPQLIGLPATTAIAPSVQSPTTVYSLVGGDANDHRAYWSYGNAISQTTTRHTASGIAWQVNVTNTGQTSNLPALYPIAKVAVNASSLVTIKAWVKLSHATDIGAKLLVQAYEIPGVTADVTATKTADTNWEELTITFTPTVKGVVQVYLAAYWLANLADESVYVDDITVTQA